MVSIEGHRISFEFDRTRVRADELIVALASRYELKDVTVAEPALETIIREIYVKGLDAQPLTIEAAT